MLAYESLHNHTTASDGDQNYTEVLATAEQTGFGVVAFCDHDTLPSTSDLEVLRAYTGPVKWLVGCEISSGLPRELGGGAASMFHILGLFTDPTDPALQEHCRQALVARAERMQRIVANLRGIGFTISEDDCLAASGGESVGRPHIVRALKSHAENEAVMEGIKADMARSAVTSPDVAMKYMRMLERDVTDHPYWLFLSDDAYVPDVYVDYLYSIDMDRSVELIRGAGGVAVMAHWPTIKRKIDADMLEGFLRDGRLDGVEVRSGFMDNQVEADERRLRGMAERTGVLVTIGIDSHRVTDFARFAGERPLANKTIGQTVRLMEGRELDSTWSNLG